MKKVEQLENKSIVEVLHYGATVKTLYEELAYRNKKVMELQTGKGGRINFHDIQAENLDEINILKEEMQQIEDIIQNYLKAVSRIMLQKLFDKNTKLKYLLQDLINESKCALKLLPIYSRKMEIMNFLEWKDSPEPFIVISGETGSGKSTQLPNYILQHLLDNPHLGRAAIVQTRKIAARALTERVCKELPSKLASLVACYGDSDYSEGTKTKILFMTDNQFIDELTYNPNLDGFSVIVVDEAHERTIESDTILGILKERICNQKLLQNIKVIVTSASIQVNKFSAYLHKCSVLRIIGRQYPIMVKYELPTHQVQDQVIDVKNLVVKLLRYKKQILFNEEKFCQENPKITWDLSVYTGHMLVFIPSKKEMAQLKRLLIHEYEREKHAEALNMHKFKLIKFHSKMNYHKYAEIFRDESPEEITKIILATKIAETSLTFSEISMVIDPGSDKESIYNPLRGFDEVRYTTISKSSAKQRAGRAGRTRPGICYRLYPVEKYRHFMDSKMPEFLSRNIEKAFLRLKRLGVDRIKDFTLLDPIPLKTIECAEERLVGYKALSNEKKITDVGEKMCQMDLIPFFSSSLFSARNLGVFNDVAKIIGMLKFATALFNPGDEEFLKSNQEKLWNQLSKKSDYEGAEGDHFLYLFIFNEFERYYEPPAEKNENDNEIQLTATNLAKEWSEKHGLNYFTLKNAYNSYREMKKSFENEVEDNQITEKIAASPKRERILQALIKSHLYNICRYSGDESLGYILLREVSKVENLFIHPSSTYSGKSQKPEFIIFSELHDFGNLIASSVTGFTAKDFSRYAKFSKVKKHMEILTNSVSNQLQTHTFNGLGSAALKRFEDKMQELQSWKLEKNILFKTNYKSGSISIWTDSESGEQRIKTVEGILEKIKTELENEKLELEVSKDTRLVLTKNAKVSDLLSGDETVTLIAPEIDSSLTSEDIHDAFVEKYGDAVTPQVIIHLDQKSNEKKAEIIFDDKKIAEKLADTKLEVKGHEIVLTKQRLEHDSEFGRIIGVRIIWFSGNPQGKGGVYLNNRQEGKQIEGLLDESTMLGKEIMAMLHFQHTKVALNNLSPAVDEIYLGEWLHKAFPRVHHQQVCVYRNSFNSEKDAALEREEFEKIIFQKAEEWSGKPAGIQHDERKFKHTYTYLFDNFDDAFNFITDLDNKQITYSLSKGRQMKKLMHAIPMMNSVIKIDKRKYKGMRTDFEKSAMMLNDKYKKVARVILPNQHNENDSNPTVVINIERVTPILDLKLLYKSVIEIKEELTRILKGTQITSLIDHEFYSLLFTKSFEQGPLRRIAQAHKLTISTDPKTQAIFIDGGSEDINQAEKALREALDANSEGYIVNEIDVTERGAYPLLNGALEPLQNKYREVHLFLKIRKGRFSVELVSRSVEALMTIKEEIGLSLEKNIQEDKTNCSLCNHRWSGGARILNCGHSYCFKCIRFYLQTLCRRQERNWCCYRKDCNEGIVVRDIIEVLPWETLRSHLSTVGVKEYFQIAGIVQEGDEEVIMMEDVDQQ